MVVAIQLTQVDVKLYFEEYLRQQQQLLETYFLVDFFSSQQHKLEIHSHTTLSYFVQCNPCCNVFM